MTYTYQWQRCDTSGGACAAISGATGATYTLGSAYVGETLRLSVTASNAGGSATASSAPTATVVATAATSLFSSNFDSSVCGPWDHCDDYSGQGIITRVSSPVDQGTAALAETVTPTSHASAAASSDAIWVWNNAKSGIGGYQSVGATETYHVAVRFPSGSYKPTTGNWNWFMENHNDSGYYNWSCASAEKANISWDVETDGPDVQYQVGLNPRLKLRVMGGPSCSPSAKWYDFGPLQLDHWYDLRYQVKWTPTSAGFVNVYVDSKLAAAYVGPTLYQRPDGSSSYTNWSLVNYRWHASWNSTIFFDDAWLSAG
jgi:hypothetical protein